MAKEATKTVTASSGSAMVPFMAAGLWSDRLQRLTAHSDVFFALSIVGILIVLLMPVPTFLLDLLLGISITFSVMVLMTVLFINRPLDFSAFPTILLIAAIFRLALNIASTRLILSYGHNGTASAGHVIEAFGSFVMAGSVVIGAILFGILTIINFVVITKGSGRIAEVAARFSLDAMPGKQMAIDADLSAGLINEDEARRRRKDLEDESAFYGSMDGASKFVRGDAIAGLLITFINFIGGIVIGIVQRDLSFSQAIESYTTLTIGDGLVSQIPALVVSVSAGMLVSKAGAHGTANTVIIAQITRHPQALAMVAFLMLMMAWMPAIPAIPFMAIAGGVGYIAWRMHQLQKKASKEAAKTKIEKDSEDKKKEESEESLSSILQIDIVRIELGYGLLPLINYHKGTKLPEQVKALRKQLARDMGFVMPSVRIQDNMQLQSNEYRICIKDIECTKGEVRPEMLLCMNPSGDQISLPGEETKEPAFGLPAKWISETMREEALFKNYTVVNPPTVITTHLTEVIKDNITDLLSYAETKKLVDALADEHKSLVSEMIPDKISIGGLQRILQNLLAERVSIKDLSGILEAVSEATIATKNPMLITEHVRSRLSRQLSFEHADQGGTVALVTLSPAWEQQFVEGLQGEGEKQLTIPPSRLQEFISAVKRAYQHYSIKGENPVLLVNPLIRPYVRSVIERFRPLTTVLSQNEIHPKVKIRTLGQI